MGNSYSQEVETPTKRQRTLSPPRSTTAHEHKEADCSEKGPDGFHCRASCAPSSTTPPLEEEWVAVEETVTREGAMSDAAHDAATEVGVDRADAVDAVSMDVADVVADDARTATQATLFGGPLTATQAHARLAAFCYRLRRLRPVNQTDPISLEPLDLSTAFRLIDAGGVVTAIDAFG
jgi:hypothetical protein